MRLLLTHLFSLSNLCTNDFLEKGRSGSGPLPRGAWDEQCGDLPKCSIVAGGSCEFSCNNILRPLPIPVSCNLKTCANLKLAPSKLHFLCEDDGRVCKK